MMHAQHPFKTAFCTDYENLLYACQHALEDWCARREQIASHGFASKEAAGEITRLQAAFVRAYSHLDTHKEHCELCRFVTRISARNHCGMSIAALDKPVA
jgi:hypothetical protein